MPATLMYPFPTPSESPGDARDQVRVTPVAGCALESDDLDSAWVSLAWSWATARPGPMLRRAQIRACAEGGSNELDFSNADPEP